MRRRDSLYLANGIVALCSSILLLVGLWQDESTKIVLGASVLLMVAGSMTALLASTDSG